MGKRFYKFIQTVMEHPFTTAVILFLFVGSLVPILALSNINCATGDDFGYGALTRQAWRSTHSLPAVFQAAGETVRKFYHGWQGTWFTLFLFTLQPEVFSKDAYVMVPFLMLFLFTFATGLLLFILLKKLCGFSTNCCLSVLALLLTASLQFIPSTKSAIFWYNGNAHYTIPYVMVMVALSAGILYLQKKKKGAYFVVLLFMSLLGGANYQAALLGFLLIGALFVYEAWRKRTFYLLLPLVTEAVGLFISMKAPGNRARGGEAFGFHIGQVIATVLQCFWQAAKEAAERFLAHPLLLLLLFCIWLIVYFGFRQAKKTLSFPCPLLALAAGFCVYSAMYAPQIYAGVEVSGGVHNMNYLVFLCMLVWDIVYLTGWYRRRYGEREQTKTTGLVFLAMGMLSVVLLFLGRSDLKDNTTYLCVDYIRSGQAKSFEMQMELYQEALLDETLLDVVLPQVNDVQGPLMHMPLTEDASAWTNTVTKEFYGKERIVAIQKDKWDARLKGGE